MPGYINLYDPALRRPREWVTLNSLALATAGLALLLVVLGAVLRWDRARVDAERAGYEREAAGLAAEMAGFGAAGGQLAELRRQLTEVRATLARKREVIDVLERGGLLRDDSFSTYLVGLSRRDVDGLWLTGFSIGPGPVAMEIRGRVSAAAALPLYLDQLGTDTVFAGRSFSSLLVARGNKGERHGRPFYADFVLTAEARQASAGAAAPDGASR